eukprot:Skav232794  [mRNA]  locus=scaffold614:285013:285824:+ [translate_table: standard]
MPLPDDSTVVISKMLSWLLRHGIKHKSVGLTSDSAEGWVKVESVLTSDYFKDMTREILMKVLAFDPPSYQLTPDLVYIRAYSTTEKKVPIACRDNQTASLSLCTCQAFKEGAAGGTAPTAVPPPEKKGRLDQVRVESTMSWKFVLFSERNDLRDFFAKHFQSGPG